jgi:hypothetical protein
MYIPYFYPEERASVLLLRQGALLQSRDTKTRQTITLNPHSQENLKSYKGYSNIFVYQQNEYRLKFATVHSSDTVT